MAATTTTATLLDQAGRPIRLGKRLGDGGEGAVYDVVGTAGRVAKLYHANRRPDADKAAKLAAMVAMSDAELLTAAAWPCGTLHESRGGRPLGFVMPRAAGRELHDLYGTQSRRQFFPDADWRFLIRVARNLSAAVDVLHRRDVVLGDVNQRNVNVGRDATVRLTDCDSFQIRNSARIWRCEVGVPQFTPAELQKCRFDQVDRTPNHDRFGLAVLIFHLLMPNYHPFMGRYPRRESLKIEEAIAGYVFPYGKDARKYGAEPPKGSPLLTDLPPEIADLFEKSFSRTSAAKDGRPTAAEWNLALARLESSLRVCPDDEGHLFPAVLGSCPWCRIENTGGANFFLTVTVARGIGTATVAFDLTAAWARISAVSPPALPTLPPPDTAVPVARPLPGDVDDRPTIRRVIGTIAAASAILVIVPGAAVFGIPLAVVFGLWWAILYFTSPLQQEQAARRQAVAQRGEAVKAVVSERDKLHHEYRRRFDAGLDALRNASRDYQGIGNEKQKAILRLEQHARERQLEAHLERQVIWHSGIAGIGPKRAETLAAYGIETAADITYEKVAAVPGFGDHLIGVLLSWKTSVQTAFRFDSRQGVPKADRDALELRFRKIGLQLQRVVAKGDSSLRAINAEFDRRLGQLQDKLASARTELAQAEADLRLAMSRKAESPLPVRALMLFLMVEVVIAIVIALVRTRDTAPLPPPTGFDVPAVTAGAEAGASVGNVSVGSQQPEMATAGSPPVVEPPTEIKGELELIEVVTQYHATYERTRNDGEADRYALRSEEWVYTSTDKGNGLFAEKNATDRELARSWPTASRPVELALLGDGQEGRLIIARPKAQPLGSTIATIIIKRYLPGSAARALTVLDLESERAATQQFEEDRSQEIAMLLKRELAGKLDVPEQKVRVEAVRTEVGGGGFQDVLIGKEIQIRSSQPRTIRRFFRASVSE